MRLEAYTVQNIPYLPTDGLTGRRKILSPVKEVTADNVRTVLEKALAVHSLNAGEINYLYNYYKGAQDIRGKVKYTRENINNKVTVNHASQIVAFKTSYLLNEPIQYISNGGEDISERINLLNEYMRSEDKESKDKEIVDWMHICGVAERLCLPDAPQEADGAPFAIYTLDPRNAFVIYNSGIGEKPIAGVILQVDEDERQIATVYTPKRMFTIKDDAVVGNDVAPTSRVPLIEYVNNDARLGAFEIVISILNNINVLESNAVDSVQEFVNGFDVFQNCELDKGEYGKLSLGGQALFIKSVNGMAEAKVYRIASELAQSGVQTRIDSLTDDYIEICGLPNRNGGSSTSDTGTAVIYRDGWSEAESRAKDTEKMFTRSEREFLRIVLELCDRAASKKRPMTEIRIGERNVFGLDLKDIKTEFLRKNLSNLQSKAQVLNELTSNDYVDPKDAYEAASLFRDNEAAYQRGMAWHNKQAAIKEQELQKELDNARLSARNTAADTEDDSV